MRNMVSIGSLVLIRTHHNTVKSEPQSDVIVLRAIAGHFLTMVEMPPTFGSSGMAAHEPKESARMLIRGYWNGNQSVASKSGKN